mgnify:CR=1 FL=1
MNVLLLTSAMREEDFSSYQNFAKIKPNPSNQNFYSKLIKLLSLHNTVSVVSRRPFTKGMFNKLVLEQEEAVDKNIKYYYTKVECSRFYKVFLEEMVIFSTAEKAIADFKSNDFIVVVDTLKISLVKAAKRIASKYNVKVVGMLTDNPLNLSNSSKLISKHLIKLVSSFDGYLSLTQGLVNVFNYSLPSYVFEGLVTEEKEGKKDPITNYFYFAGSLYERYGVKALVDAYHESNLKYKLLIAGSGPLDKYIEKLEEEDYRILYLSQLNKEKNIAYMRNAIANINPRPLNKKMDSESVPSKLLEYLSLGIPVISTKYDKLYGPFKDDVTWIDGNDKEAIIKALESYDVDMQEEHLKKAASARRKVFEFYGLEIQAESINYFLADINSSTRR